MSAVRCGFLGAGKMATALARGWLSAGLIDARGTLASDPVPQARDAFHKDTGLAATADNRDVVAAADLLVLAVKPQSMPALLAEIKPLVGERHLIVSIAAGVTLQQISHGLGGSHRLIRVMPNTPCLVNASAAGFSPGARHARTMSRWWNVC